MHEIQTLPSGKQYIRNNETGVCYINLWDKVPIHYVCEVLNSGGIIL